MNKECGDCTVCCTNIMYHGERQDINKKCRFLDPTCSIYATRDEWKPAHCTPGWNCAWLTEPTFPDWMRPDLSGMVILYNNHFKMFTERATWKEPTPEVEEFITSINIKRIGS